MFRPTPKLSQLATCKKMQQRCIEQCTKIDSYTNSPALTKVKVRDVFRIFASMAHGATFGELCVRFNPSALNINERKMVLFGLLEGLIRRVDKYPITVLVVNYIQYLNHFFLHAYSFFCIFRS